MAVSAASLRLAIKAAAQRATRAAFVASAEMADLCCRKGMGYVEWAAQEPMAPCFLPVRNDTMTQPDKEKPVVWGLSLDGWNNLIVAFLVAASIFGVLAAAATYIAFQLQKQEAVNAANTLAQYQVVASVKIADAHAAGEAAKADEARAHEAAAKANERAAEAELALAKIKTPRTISPHHAATMIAKLKQFSGTPYALYLFDDPEAASLLNQIERILEAAGWNGRSGIGDMVKSRPNKPDIAMTRMNGLFVQIDSDHQSILLPAGSALAGTLRNAGLIARLEAGNFPAPIDKTAIRIVVGQKRM